MEVDFCQISDFRLDVQFRNLGLTLEQKDKPFERRLTRGRKWIKCICIQTVSLLDLRPYLNFQNKFPLLNSFIGSNSCTWFPSEWGGDFL